MFFINAIVRMIPVGFFVVVAIAAAQQLPDETVVVTANAVPVPFENLSRTVLVFDREDINTLPIQSVMDILERAASVDVRSRSPYGMQADISVRGSAYSQVLVLVDGLRINDSQTAHHNSDFPVQLQDIDRIEVLLGAGSSIYGADAFGGTINIITRHPDKPVYGSIAWGQYGLVKGSGAAHIRKGTIEQSVGISGDRSSGFQDNRDFNSIGVSSRTTIRERSTLFVSYVDKEFGADRFYGPAPSREWTNQAFASLTHKFEGGSGDKTVVKGYYRTHGDRFLYDINRPELFESRHRTHATGVHLKTQHRLSDTGLMTFGGELGGDWISSGVLGDHSFARTGVFGEFQWTPGKSIAVHPGLRFDYYSNFGTAFSPSLSGSWWVRPRLRLRSSAGHAFRIPSFTELYYRDPNNEASSSLKPERAWSAEVGADFIPADNWLGSLTVFTRKERDVIDWIRSSTSEKWKTANIRNLRTTGFELRLERSFGSQARLSTQYSRITTSAGPIDYISKYVLDYARDSWAVSSSFKLPFELAYKQTVSYRRRSDGRSYWLWDGSLEKGFYKFIASVDYTNLLDSRYEEIRDVDMPGRWFVFSLRTR